jgi:eukaryotic-like serine/threonine-protein kinase
MTNDDDDNPPSVQVMAFPSSPVPASDVVKGAILGIGGTAIVYSAREPSLGRDVAMKVKNATTPIDRFLAEARVTAQLDHPFIPPVHRISASASTEVASLAL